MATSKYSEQNFTFCIQLAHLHHTNWHQIKENLKSVARKDFEKKSFIVTLLTQSFLQWQLKSYALEVADLQLSCWLIWLIRLIKLVRLFLCAKSLNWKRL